MEAAIFMAGTRWRSDSDENGNADAADATQIPTDN